jgi:lipopolysaccharide/colanic/teichoic acid biosynthesis glycosyltransferase
MMVGAGSSGLLLELARRQFRLFKDLFDVGAGLVLAVLFTPVMIACALMIKISDPAGPVLFRQVRVGRDGRLFTMFKLRSMYVDAEARGGAQWCGADDPRIIPVCRWMRKSHVDELPQLWNIIRGEMSLVGPRPERPELFESLSNEMPEYERRVEVKPGLTGLAQIRNGYDTDMSAARRKLQLDLEYISRMSLVLDLRLLVATVTKFNDSRAR